LWCFAKRMPVSICANKCSMWRNGSRVRGCAQESCQRSSAAVKTDTARKLMHDTARSQERQRIPQLQTLLGIARCRACSHPQQASPAALLGHGMCAPRPVSAKHALLARTSVNFVLHAAASMHHQALELKICGAQPGTCRAAGGSSMPRCTPGGCSATAKKGRRPCTCTCRPPAPAAGA